MSFKITFFLFLINILGCGVKSDVISPPKSSLPNYESKFLKIEGLSLEKKEKKKKEDQKKK